MKQFVLNAVPDAAGFCRLTGKDYHYLVHVRRAQKGEELNALLPSGAPVRAVVAAIEKTDIVLQVTSYEEQRQEEALPLIFLLQALPKGSKMDLIVRQAAECGVQEVVPFESERSVPHCEEGAAAARQERWQRIAREATQQSGAARPPRIHAPLKKNAVFSMWESLRAEDAENTLGLVAHTAPLEQSPLHGYLRENIKLIALAIGPEGGFSPQEASAFMLCGFKPLSLGYTILRTETAALYTIAAIRVLLMEKNSWIHIAKG